jgi:ABC transport system ATP-binding/permease protein
MGLNNNSQTTTNTLKNLPLGMNYLSVEQLSKSFGIKPLFNDISFGINKGEKVGLIAKNGSGKTTLLKILAGDETPDSGLVVFRKGIQI